MQRNKEMGAKDPDLTGKEFLVALFFMLFALAWGWIGPWAIVLAGILFVFGIGIYASIQERKSQDRAERRQIAESASRRIVEDAINRCLPLIESHKETLASEKRRLIRRDSYGTLMEEDWQKGPKGIEYFIGTVLRPSIGEQAWSQAIENSQNHYNGTNDFRLRLSSLVNEAADSVASKDTLSDDANGIDYEIFCEGILSRSGWRVVRTPATGDQGVDLIATKNQIRACIQCKYYSKPVGNSAVQEVLAGKMFWEGSMAVVVSSAGYTRSARQLAEASSVVLLHHDDLLRLSQILASHGSNKL